MHPKKFKVGDELTFGTVTIVITEVQQVTNYIDKLSFNILNAGALSEWQFTCCSDELNTTFVKENV